MYDRIQVKAGDSSMSGRLAIWTIVLFVALFSQGPVAFASYGEPGLVATSSVLFPLAKFTPLAGAVWMIPAALISYKMERGKGFTSPLQHAVLEAVGSVSLLLPWFYQVFVIIRGRPFLKVFARLNYMFVYMF